MSLELSPILNDKNEPIYQTQDRHIVLFNSLNKIMASMADYYEAGKSNNPSLITNIQQDLNSWIMSSDRMNYNSNSLEAVITSYFGSTVTESVVRKVIVPFYNGETLTNVLADTQGLAYIQTLFNTTDTADEIKTSLFQLTGKFSDQTKVWTSDQANRKANPSRVASLYYDSGSFLILGDLGLSDYGRSRGVLDSPAGTALNPKYVIPVSSDNISPELRKGIDAKSECVYLSNIQEVGDYSKYAGTFYFHNNRFVYSMTSKKIDDDSLDNRISVILALSQDTKEKLGKLEEKFHPVYAHLQKYEKNEKGFSLVDDAESFAEPILVKQ